MYTFVYVFVQIIKKGNDVVLLELVSRGQCIVQSVVQFLYGNSGSCIINYFHAVVPT